MYRKWKSDIEAAARLLNRAALNARLRVAASGDLAAVLHRTTENFSVMARRLLAE